MLSIRYSIEKLFRLLAYILQNFLLCKFSFNTKQSIKAKNEDKENNIITFVKRINFLLSGYFYHKHLFVKMPFTAVFTTNTFPLSGYFFSSSSFKFSLAEVIIR